MLDGWRRARVPIAKLRGRQKGVLSPAPRPVNVINYVRSLEALYPGEQCSGFTVLLTVSTTNKRSYVICVIFIFGENYK